MKLKKYARTSLMAGVMALAALALTFATPAKAQDKADPVGTWKWTKPTPNGDAKYSLVLKMDGGKLTGRLTSPVGGGGGDSMTAEIKNAKIDSDTITFEIIVPNGNGGRDRTNSYNGKITGDTMKLTLSGFVAHGGVSGTGNGGHGGVSGTGNGGGGGGPEGPMALYATATREKQ
jgi:hypothetical protein